MVENIGHKSNSQFYLAISLKVLLDNILGLFPVYVIFNIVFCCLVNCFSYRCIIYNTVNCDMHSIIFFIRSWLSLLPQEQVRQSPEGIGLRTENLRLICFLEDKTNDYQENWDTERDWLLGWNFSNLSFSFKVFKLGFMRRLKGFWLCRCLGRSWGFTVQIIYFLIILSWSVMKMYFVEVLLEISVRFFLISPLTSTFRCEILLKV